MSIVEHLRAISENAPFLLAAGGTAIPEATNRLDSKRVTEQAITGVIVAIVIGTGGYFLALPALTKELQGVQTQLNEMRLEAKEERLLSQAQIQRLTEKVHQVELELVRKTQHALNARNAP